MRRGVSSFGVIGISRRLPLLPRLTSPVVRSSAVRFPVVQRALSSGTGLENIPEGKTIMRTEKRRSKMAPSFLQRFLGGKKSTSEELRLTGPASRAVKREDSKAQEPRPEEQKSETDPKLNALFAFVDPKDPFAPSEVAGEELPGPILSILGARHFSCVYLFHTPHTRQNAFATKAEAAQRHPECKVELHELTISEDRK